MKPEHTQLNLGCGVKKLEKYWNVDKNVNVSPDEVMDMEIFPWPYDDNTFTNITAEMVMHQVGAHPDVFAKIIQEMYRVSQHNAEWHISVPHPRCDWIYEDFRNVRALSATSFLAFDQKKNFEVIAKKSHQPCHGMDLSVDIELIEAKPSLIPYWRTKLEQKLVGEAELDTTAMISNNVFDSMLILLKVHKPGRFQDWRATQKSR